MKTSENDDNRGHNNGSVPHGQYMYLTISALSVVTGKSIIDRSINVLSVSFTVHIRFVRYTSVTRPLVDRSLSVTCPVRMRYSCVLCAPYTFVDDLHRHRDDFHHRITIFCIFSVRSASVNAIR